MLLATTDRPDDFLVETEPPKWRACGHGDLLQYAGKDTKAILVAGSTCMGRTTMVKSLLEASKKQPALTPPRLRGGARRGISKGSGAGGDSVGNATGVDCLPMFCPVPAVVSDSVSHRPADVLWSGT